ncbi:energy transducer TonB [Portibacter lacus]|uniref:TonB C-terminal domain-containing protein n=1 Tax=Portibacter lacus TaxID=1099794 RepID=A0AA37WGU4_9BACT|nr:energy transducer TonB [Portibacter lacus]GLR18195.1 hypothetical protein GCM10007940_28100 [Portibacter lacus]
MKRSKKEKHFIQRAFYKGGMEALKRFIQNELQYPELAKKEGIQGTVNLKFHVNYQGKVHSVKVISGIGHGCDEEAIRIVSNLKYEVPKSYKKKIGFQKKINIHFRLKKVVTPLPKSLPKQGPNQDPKLSNNSYTISSTSSTSTSYNYTIRTSSKPD